MLVQLNRRERELLRKVIRIQLKSIKKLIREDTEDDITLICIEEGINKESLKELMRENLVEYQRVYWSPGRFLELNEDHLSMVKHLMETQVNGFSMEKRSIWYKMTINETINLN